MMAYYVKFLVQLLKYIFLIVGHARYCNREHLGNLRNFYFFSLRKAVILAAERIDK